jgi:folylpolyglutamate synthase
MIHIAGTKGKGSTAAYTERILRDQGYKTGLFTSPHMVSPCERIRINGAPISEEVFTSAFWTCHNHLLRSADENNHDLHFFQILLLMGLSHFSKEQVDVAIIETGVGGRGDVTNFIRPKVCAITLIDYDHMATLGNTLPEIADQKAGIIKVWTPLWWGITD